VAEGLGSLELVCLLVRPPSLSSILFNSLFTNHHAFKYIWPELLTES
jgi:hypothetical protein